MINTITQVLEQLGLSAQKRAIHAQFSPAALNHDIFLQHIEGTHALNQGLNVELICLSTNALIPLKQFIGVQVAVDQVTDQGIDHVPHSFVDQTPTGEILVSTFDENQIFPE